MNKELTELVFILGKSGPMNGLEADWLPDMREREHHHSSKTRAPQHNHLLFWWIFLGRAWVCYLLVKWTLIVGYYILVKWWTDLIQNAQRREQGLPPKGKITCVC